MRHRTRLARLMSTICPKIAAIFSVNFNLVSKIISGSYRHLGPRMRAGRSLPACSTRQALRWHIRSVTLLGAYGALRRPIPKRRFSSLSENYESRMNFGSAYQRRMYFGANSVAARQRQVRIVSGL